MKLLERRVVISALIKEKVDSGLTVSDEKVKAFFDDNQVTYGAEERRLSHILVKDQSLAKKLLSRIRKGYLFKNC